MVVLNTCKPELSVIADWFSAMNVQRSLVIAVGISCKISTSEANNPNWWDRIIEQLGKMFFSAVTAVQLRYKVLCVE